MPLPDVHPKTRFDTHADRLARNIGSPYTRERPKKLIQNRRNPVDKGDRCRRRLWIVIIVVVAVGAAGCAGPGKMLGRTPMEYKIPPQKATAGKAAQGRSLPAMAASAATPPTIRWGISLDPTTHMAFNFTAGAAPAGAAIPALSPSMLGVVGLLVGVLGVGLLRHKFL